MFERLLASIAAVSAVVPLGSSAAASPPGCQGRGDASLTVSILDVGSDGRFTVTGRPGARFALAADRHPGPTETSIGLVCLHEIQRSHSGGITVSPPAHNC